MTSHKAISLTARLAVSPSLQPYLVTLPCPNANFCLLVLRTSGP